MLEFETEDLPLVIDAAFALALNAYALALYQHVEDNFSIKDVLMDRFTSQGFGLDRSKKISEIVDKTINKMIVDAKNSL